MADALVKLAREHDAAALVVGMHEHRRLTRLGPSKTLTDLFHAAPCPVLVCGTPKPGAYADPAPQLGISFGPFRGT